MAFLPLADATTATGRPRQVLVETERKWGFVPNIVRALALRPELLEAEDRWTQALMHTGTLPRVLKEAVATTVSAVNSCDYCATSHAYMATANGADDRVVGACRALRFDGLSEAERVALEFARKAATDMASVSQVDVDRLRKHYRPDQIVELAAVIASFMMYNTFVTVLGLELEDFYASKTLGRGR